MRMDSRRRSILGLIIFLALVWLLSDFVFLRSRVYDRAFEFNFQNRPWGDVRKFTEDQSAVYRRSFRGEDQMLALVNMIECFHYLLYNNRITLDSYYNLARMIIVPGQRTRLREEARYVYEAGKYLRKMRNLEINYLGYEVSFPMHRPGSERTVADVFVVRSAVRGREYIRYRFRKVQNRYFLSLRSAGGPGIFRLDSSSPGEFIISRPREEK